MVGRVHGLIDPSTKGEKPMRVAGGVILIIAAVMNLFAAIGYLGAGAMMGGAGKLTSMVEEESKKQGRELTDEQVARIARILSYGKEVKETGGGAGTATRAGDPAADTRVGGGGSGGGDDGVGAGHVESEAEVQARRATAYAERATAAAAGRARATREGR